MRNEFRISREYALCFAKFREKATSTRPYPPPPGDSVLAILRSAEWRVGRALVVSVLCGECVVIEWLGSEERVSEE